MAFPVRLDSFIVPLTCLSSGLPSLFSWTDCLFPGYHGSSVPFQAKRPVCPGADSYLGSSLLQRLAGSSSIPKYLFRVTSFLLRPMYTPSYQRDPSNSVGQSNPLFIVDIQSGRRLPCIHLQALQRLRRIHAIEEVSSHSHNHDNL